MIYADNAATTRLSECAYDAMLPYLKDQFGNASAQHSFGTKANRAIKHSRKQIATSIGADVSEIRITSCGSESNSWVFSAIRSGHVITTAIEHTSVLQACRALEAKGVSVSYLPVDSYGCVALDDIKTAIQPDTKLVSIMLANNEVGTIQPIAQIGEFLREQGILFHTDAVQAVGHIPVDIRSLQIDFMSASAHKFNGLKGAGFLFIRKGTSLPAIIYGGKQECGIRGGTENVPAIVAMGCALEDNISAMETRTAHLYLLRKTTISELSSAIPSVRIHRDCTDGLPGIISVGFEEKITSETMMHLLDSKGIIVSAGSACSSGDDVPSHVLLAMGLSPKQAKSTIRISYDYHNTIEDVRAIVDAIAWSHKKITASM